MPEIEVKTISSDPIQYRCQVCNQWVPLVKPHDCIEKLLKKVCPHCGKELDG